MKKISTVSLFIFGVVVVAVLTSGLVFYQNNKNSLSNQNEGSPSLNLIKNEINKINPSGGTITLDMAEISKHNKASDCWMLISGKVYDVTSYFGSHPGGNVTMSPTCGTDATSAYATRDPYAKTGGSKVAHSSSAKSSLDNYYLGNLNQVIGESNKKTNTNTVSVSNSASSAPVNTNNTVKTNTATNPIIVPAENITLTLSEIAKHNKQSDCFILVKGKVYNITSYFGSHPGGSGVMSQTCGTDATAAYATQNPNATSSGASSAHSSNAASMLANYYIGDLNQSIGQQKITETNTIVAPANTGDEDEDEDEDEEEDD